jgi:hypothetical protein
VSTVNAVVIAVRLGTDIRDRRSLFWESLRCEQRGGDPLRCFEWRPVTDVR